MSRKWRLRLLVFAFLAWPWFVSEQPWSFQGVRAAFWVLSVLSVIVLTGWVGQVSLAQAALMGIGAFSAARASLHLGIDFPFHALVAGGAAALAAVLIGVAALRIRGLYLAIATLGFQWMMESSLLQWHAFSGGYNGVVIEPLTLGAYDFSSDRLFYYLAWPTTILLILLVANLRDSKVGRAWFAIRSSEVAAKTLGIDVVRYKLLAFAVSGFIVGVAGAIQLNFVGSATPQQFIFPVSILLLAIAVLGGVAHIGGAIVGGLLFTISDYIFSTTPALRGKIDLVAAALLIWTILQNPGGVIEAREHLKERIAAKRVREHARRRPGDAGTAVPHPPATTFEAPPMHAPPGAADRDVAGPATQPVPALRPSAAAAHGISGGAGPERPEALAARLDSYLAARGPRAGRGDAPAVLRAHGVTVRFGGVLANHEVTLEVRSGEICGLIGPNGAGKTTFFNAVNGLVTPAEGRVELAGLDVTHAPVHIRAALGMSRTFQIMKLFPRLTVLENLMVANHLHAHAGFVSNALMLKPTQLEDSRGRRHAEEILGFLGIAEHADRRVAGLPFGLLRLVELGRALMTGPKLLLLDEPASGLDVAETDAFAEHLFRVRDEMGHTILIIEHDMRLVMTVSDYVYVLEFGRNLADGPPAQVQRNDAVVAAYLGEERIA